MQVCDVDFNHGGELVAAVANTSKAVVWKAKSGEIATTLTW
jgi:hypothetical protein